MRPAFSSTGQAGAFAILLLALLLSPVLMGKRFLPPRREIYSSIWWESGDYPFFYHQIFDESKDINILFIGASHIHTAFGTPYVQDQLSRALGRPAVARTFGWGWPGYDTLYFVTKDLLEHRRVRMIVFDDLYAQNDRPHVLAPRLFRLGDDADALDGLSLRLKASYYFAAIVGMPRNSLGLVRSNFPPNLQTGKPTYFEIHDRALSPISQLGALTEHMGFAPNFLAEYYDHPPFIPCSPKTAVKPSDVCIYSADTKTNFIFNGGGLPPMQLHFAQKFAAFAQEHGCKLVMLHIPFYNERRSPVIPEPVFWPDVLGANVTMVGIPPATLFKGLTDEEIRKLYSDPVHLNQNGQRYFTALMTPSLLKIYESGIQKN